MRVARGVALLLLLQERGRITSRELAEELEVSTRTVLRDIEALSSAGVPVYSVRGSKGGFELLDGYRRDLPNPSYWQPTRRRPGRTRRATLRLSPAGLRLAALTGRPSGIRRRRDRGSMESSDSWVEVTMRMESIDSTALDVLALGPDCEVTAPEELRLRIADAAEAIGRLYRV